jgi:hypothetical protein
MLDLYGHTASKLEQAILEYLGEFSDPFKVSQYLALTEKQDTEKYEVGTLLSIRIEFVMMNSPLLFSFFKEAIILIQANFVKSW